MGICKIAKLIKSNYFLSLKSTNISFVFPDYNFDTFLSFGKRRFGWKSLRNQHHILCFTSFLT